MFGESKRRFRPELEELLQYINQKITEIPSDVTVAVQIIDVKYPQDTDDESPVSNASISVKVRVIDQVHRGYGEIDDWIPLNIDVGRAMAEYGSLLVNKRAKMKLPYFPQLLGAYISRIVSPMYQQEEIPGESTVTETYISEVAKTRNIGVF
tara:strand:+ start:4463 stop:4918 length:456 start_codon:yes stop_codon:yes gene_type:complete